MVADENIVLHEGKINFLFRDVLTYHILIVDSFPASLLELEFNFPSFDLEGLYLRFLVFSLSLHGLFNIFEDPIDFRTGVNKPETIICLFGFAVVVHEPGCKLFHIDFPHLCHHVIELVAVKFRVFLRRSKKIIFVLLFFI